MQTSTEIRTNPATGRVPTPFRSPVYYIYPIRTAAGKFELSGNGEGHPIDSHQQSTKSLTNRRTVKSESPCSSELYLIDSYEQSVPTPTNRQEVDFHRPADGEMYVADLNTEASKSVTYRGDVSQKSALGIRHLIDVLLYMVGGAYALAH